MMHVSLRSYGGEVLRHAHDFHQVVLPVAGVLEMTVGRMRGRVHEAGGVLVAGGVEHGFRASDGNRFVVLDLSAAGRAGVPDALVRQAAAAPFFTLDEGLRHLAGYLACEAGDGRLRTVAAHQAAGLLVRALEARLLRPAGGPPGPVARAVDLIERCFDEPLTVADLAGVAGLSPARLHGHFRRALGCTPGEYLAHRRLDAAEALLRDGTLPIAEIALAAGYSDQSALTRSLKRRRGITPAALRRAAAREGS